MTTLADVVRQVRYDLQNKRITRDEAIRLIRQSSEQAGAVITEVGAAGLVDDGMPASQPFTQRGRPA